ncbi:MAG: fibronectin type III domain-containing protein [Saprospiraceae bacterium]|nr:fibronectin type III domain-containing protein [Saprospiraceae bacterium]
MFRFLIMYVFVLVFPYVGSTQSISVKPFLQVLDENSTKIVFETTTVTTAAVHFGPTPFDLNTIVAGTSQTGNGSSRIFTTHLQNLSELTKYYYKVVLANGVQSAVYHFITLASQEKEQNINFISMSDIQRQGSYPNVYSNIINNGIIPIMNQDFENGLDDLHGLLIPGDLVQNGGAYSTWKSDFFDLGENVTTVVPIYPALGNHEYYDNGLQNYLKYFDLPLNGDANFPEQWWYKDFSNIRVISLNSNSNSTEKALQITWLNNLLNSICTNPQLDFVFVQLHHPYKSEPWTPGESSFTGQVVGILENFTTTCHKPTIHLFGHTHAYSRGQSKLHQHLWVNVATAGGAIDYWGQYPNHDYDEFSHSEDEYGFVLLKGQAGPDPEILVKRYSRGDDGVTKNNEITDSIVLKKFDFSPQKPKAIWPTGNIDFNCTTLKAGSFFDPKNFHQASQWQLSLTNDFSSPLFDVWKQHKNLYNNVDAQSGEDLTDEDDFVFTPGTTYYWRVRYRDNYLRWSEWSDPQSFATQSATMTTNLLINPDGENGITSWNGQIEALTSNQCNSVPVYQGSRFFGVGGICANEQNLGLADQSVNVSAYANQIDNGVLHVYYGGYLRTWGVNNDLPEVSVEFINESGQTTTTSFFGNNQPQWLLVQRMLPIPPLTRRIKFILRGTRISGGDNDSYFDNLFLRLVEATECPQCFGLSGTDNDNDGFCSDVDCNENDAEIYPGAVELCDTKDNNCDLKTDTGTQVNWTGNGDGVNWTDPQNWSQNMVPLPCQHVFISVQDSVVIDGYHVVKSLTIGNLAIVEISEGGHLVMEPSFENNISSLNLAGVLFNSGRMDINKSSLNGIAITGNLNNTGRIYINGIQNSSILSNTGSILENQGLIKIKH